MSAVAANLRVALVTARDSLALDEDMPLLLAACRAAGLNADTPCWDDPSVEWQRYAAVALRSPWNYVPRLAEFRAFVTRIESLSILINPRDLIDWNIDKHYLAELAAAGVATVPTRFVEPGVDAAAALDEFLHAPRGATPNAGLGSAADFVIKPAVGAGSKDAARYRAADPGEGAGAQAHLARLLADGRSAMLQPYLASVDARGETALIYIDGRLSHAIRKGPLLHRGAEHVAGLFAAEQISAREPSKDEGRLGKAAFNAIPGPAPLYARVDLIEADNGAPCVLELELVEPSLFFAHGEGSAQRYAQALKARIEPAL